jgi:hypothetical protein
MQSAIVKYGMDNHLNQFMCTDMPLSEIRTLLRQAYGAPVTNGDIESYYKYNTEDPLYQRYLKKLNEENKLKQ